MPKIKYIIIFTLSVNILFSQDCFAPDEKIWQNPWQSCQQSSNPNSDYGQSHWIMYNLGEIRLLSKSWIWNCNDPKKLSQGFADIKVDYSSDGVNWTYWDDFYCPKANGDLVYPGFSGPDLQGIKAQFILLSVISTHGDGDCASLSDIKFNLLPGYEEGVTSSTLQITNEDKSFHVYPNPCHDIIYISGDLSRAVEFNIYNVIGRLQAKGSLLKINSINIENLQSGTYFIHLGQEVHRIFKI